MRILPDMGALRTGDWVKFSIPRGVFSGKILRHNIRNRDGKHMFVLELDTGKEMVIRASLLYENKTEHVPDPHSIDRQPK